MHPRELLNKFGCRPQKRLGQNFLVDGSAARRIASLACMPGVLKILEIGPGTGMLTAALVERGAGVTAIDVDPAMIRILQSQPDLKPATIVQADALEFDYHAFAAGQRWSVTGNLPYNLATPLVMRLVEMKDGPQQLVVMVQKEVAGRMRALPGSRAYGSLSVALQYAMTVELPFTLKPGAFYPRPKVESAVVRLVRRPEPAVRVADERWFLQVVRAAFAYRRKTLANSASLALGLERRAVENALYACELDREIRGEQLGLADFARLSDLLPHAAV
jgi:16S rRNA (adenine1518-N6/adenine1519-N6)-dimethyltransferase